MEPDGISPTNPSLPPRPDGFRRRNRHRTRKQQRQRDEDGRHMPPEKQGEDDERGDPPSSGRIDEYCL